MRLPCTSNQTLGLEEFQEIHVELVLVGFRQPVGCSGINLQGRVLAGGGGALGDAGGESELRTAQAAIRLRPGA